MQDNDIHTRDRLNEHSIAIEKVRDRVHDLANSVSSISSAMITTTKNMDEVIAIQKIQTQTLEGLKAKSRDMNIIKAILKSPTTYMIIGLFAYISDKTDISKTIDNISNVWSKFF